MKYFKIKKHILLISLFALPACSVFETKKVVDPNLPSQESVLTNATAVQINELGIGLQSVMRNGLSSFRVTTGGIGREVYDLSSVETTFTTELLGTTNGGLSLTTGFNGSYDDFSQTRRRAALFMAAANASTALNETQRNTIRGFCNTVEGWAMLFNLQMQYQNGIRISFTDLSAPGDMLNPGPFVSYTAGLTEIKRLLDLGYSQLIAAGAASFAFPITAGWTSAQAGVNFNTPATFATFNRGVAAKVAMYQADWNGVVTALNASFFNLSGALATGPVFTYSTTSGDIVNPIYHIKNDIVAPYVAQQYFNTDAEPADTRVSSKTSLRTSPRTLNGLVGKFDVFIYPTNISPISILRNEELILMYAEAQIQLGNLDAGISALDMVRTKSGLPAMASSTKASISSIPGEPDPTVKKAKLIDELLNERRYSLFFEGHRWFDMRRYGRLDQLPNDLTTMHVYTQMIRPFAEVQWDAKHPQ